MSRWMKQLSRLLQGISQAVVRFPLTVACLIGSTALACYLISLHRTPGLLVQKLFFVFLVGAMLGITAQFALERWPEMARRRGPIYLVAALLTLGYYLIIAPAPTIDYSLGARTAVAVFSLFNAFIWLPSFGGKYDFNSVALVHFKSALTSLLFAGVLAAGLAALFAAVDVLLFPIDSDLYGYMLAIVWLTFAPVHYLSRLPYFNSHEPSLQAAAKEASDYPRILEILISQIAIPLVGAYTLVLFSYFLKIAFTRNWPIGQLGPMILGYSAAGLLIYILASRLGNRLAVGYQRLFPKVLIPIVLVQLVSVYIRLRAYGVTESRYYVALFGILTLVVGVVLSWQPVTKNGVIALLAAGFAICSIIPPIDAFSVSRQSQVGRLEQMLQAGGVLVDGRLVPQPEAERELRRETTDILNYLDRRGHITGIAWLPADFQPYRDMRVTFGFDPTYGYQLPDQGQNWFLNLDMPAALPISGYDRLLQLSAFRGQTEFSQPLTVGGKPYQLRLERQSAHEVIVSLQDAAGKPLVSTGLEQFVRQLSAAGQAKELLPAEKLTLDAADGGYRLRIIFQNVHSTDGSGDERDGTDYSFYALVAVPPAR